MQYVLYNTLVQRMREAMTDFYTQLMEKSGFDEALVRHALNFTRDIDTSEFLRLFFDTEPFSVLPSGVLFFKEAFFPYEFFAKLKTLPLPIEKSALYVYLRLMPRGHCNFLKDDNIFFDSMKRISEEANLYFKENGDYGLYDYHFLANHIRGSIVRLSGFEYQLGHFEDKKAIILHLPENADLSKENRLESYKLARQYFGDFPIIADSWLLYPEHKKMLSKDSRILQFMDDFETVSIHETTDYSELFHVFGRLSDFSYENLPKETSLQKAYAERIKNNLPICSAIGKLKH